MGQHFDIAFKHIRRAPYQALAAIATMVFTFFVATVLAVLAYASTATLKYFETRPQVIAFLKDDITADQISSLQRKLEEDVRLKNVKYVTKDQALKIYKEATSDNPELSALVSPKVFPASLEFTVIDLSFTENVLKEIEGEPVIKQVVFTASLGDTKNYSEVIQNLQRVTYYIRVGGASILLFLLASSLLVLLVIIGMRISSRREEIEILQLIGATPGFIRMPFVIEGIFYSIGGAFVGWVTSSLLLIYLIPFASKYFGEITIFPESATGLLFLFGIILGAEILLGIILGTTGSLIAIKRYLKK
ncbi:MAG: permease-like cell division protein FtsX [bacterium]|nr:permease-like cell division protein FtsX [bacterium]